MRGRFHYGWVIVATGILTVISCLGFARFALGMILPAMGESLGLSYSEMGFISTGNFIGYLIAVILSGRLYTKFGARKLIVTGALTCSLMMMAVSRAEGFWQVFIAYIVTGIGTGTANVPIMALIPHWFRRSHRGRASGFIVTGSGIGIIISGWLIPLVNSALGVEGWRSNWLILGLASIVTTIIALTFLRNDPAEVGQEPLGVDPPPSEEKAGGRELAPERAILLLGTLYFLFGYTYVIYATFIVTTLVNEVGLSEAVAGKTWMWIGAFSLFSGPVFGALSDKLGRREGLAAVFTFQMASYLLMAFHGGMWSIYLSVGLYGFVCWAIPGIMGAAVGDYMGPQRAAMAFGTITLFFGVGQVVGPSVAGMLADASGSFSTSYMMAAAMAAVAIATTRLIPKKR